MLGTKKGKNGEHVPNCVPEETVQELSNDTLASYKKKAGAEITDANAKGDFKKADRRFSGIVKATNKQFDNDKKAREQKMSTESLKPTVEEMMAVRSTPALVSEATKNDMDSYVSKFQEAHPKAQLHTANLNYHTVGVGHRNGKASSHTFIENHKDGSRTVHHIDQYHDTNHLEHTAIHQFPKKKKPNAVTKTLMKEAAMIVEPKTTKEKDDTKLPAPGRGGELKGEIPKGFKAKPGETGLYGSMKEDTATVGIQGPQNTVTAVPPEDPVSKTDLIARADYRIAKSGRKIHPLIRFRKVIDK